MSHADKSESTAGVSTSPGAPGVVSSAESVPADRGGPGATLHPRRPRDPGGDPALRLPAAARDLLPAAAAGDLSPRHSARTETGRRSLQRTVRPQRSGIPPNAHGRWRPHGAAVRTKIASQLSSSGRVRVPINLPNSTNQVSCHHICWEFQSNTIVVSFFQFQQCACVHSTLIAKFWTKIPPSCALMFPENICTC